MFHIALFNPVMAANTGKRATRIILTDFVSL